MNDALTNEVKEATAREILAVLKARGLPTPETVTDGVRFLMKVVSCAHQMDGQNEASRKSVSNFKEICTRALEQRMTIIQFI